VSKYAATTANKFLQLSDDRLGTYNAWDSYNTARLVQPLLQELRDNHQLDHYEAHVEPLQMAVVRMQRRGMLLDREARTQYRKGLRAELQECDDFLGEQTRGHSSKVRDSFNANSTQQIQGLLFSSIEDGGLGLRPTKRTEKGAPSVDQEALTQILRNLRVKDRHAIPTLHALFHRSRLQTINERYLDFQPDPDGKVRARVKMAKAKTLRLAYSDPAKQQWVKEIRHILVAEEGKVFVGVDYSQLEARLLAYLARDEVSIDVFESGGDVHHANAIDLFGHENILEKERDYSKSWLYKISYGGRGSDKERTACPCTRR